MYSKLAEVNGFFLEAKVLKTSPLGVMPNLETLRLVKNLKPEKNRHLSKISSNLHTYSFVLFLLDVKFQVLSGKIIM